MNLIEAKKLIEEFTEYDNPKLLLAKHVQAMCVLLLELEKNISFITPVHLSKEAMAIPNITEEKLYDLIKNEKKKKHYKGGIKNV